MDHPERTVGAALRGRPRFAHGFKKITLSGFANTISTEDGHGGPPLQYVLRGLEEIGAEGFVGYV